MRITVFLGAILLAMQALAIDLTAMVGNTSTPAAPSRIRSSRRGTNS